jgi:serine/threonine protein kinase
MARRTVALKVIKPGLASPELLRRFEQESQALARLQHPGIAQIYEAGTADTVSGPQPYFAMEFIHGESLLEYATAHRLNTRQRLALMAKVCDAVQHAHQRPRFEGQTAGKGRSQPRKLRVSERPSVRSIL